MQIIRLYTYFIVNTRKLPKSFLMQSRNPYLLIAVVETPHPDTAILLLHTPRRQFHPRNHYEATTIRPLWQKRGRHAKILFQG